ncbi:MAG: iron ABC transporter permease [Desulfovibrionaceae bacterium]|nr:iron ABC transporter permease [Desulfovibrionaceae bacterium]
MGAMNRAGLLLPAAVLIWLASVPLACWAGPLPFSLTEVWQGMLARCGLMDAGQLDGRALLIIGDIRLARVVLALLCGGALAVAGATLQGVLRNPLADPFTLGISAGAACGASLVLGGGGLWLARYGLATGGAVAAAAFAGALAALACALALGRGGGSFARETVILAGIAVATFLGAVVALIKALNEESVTSIVFWIMGSFQGRGWDSLPWLAVPLLCGGAVIACRWRELDVLALGDRQAAQLGLNVGRTRLLLLAGASCMTAACVAVSGVIGFVGLVVPHILRHWLGAGHGPLLAGAWLGGGILLVWADVLARTALGGGQELPVGVVTSLLGGPFFAALVRRGSMR